MNDITAMSSIPMNDRIKARLEALGKSAAGASVEAGLGRSAITDILAGNSGSPRLITLEKLAGVLDCSVGYLIGMSENPEEGRGTRFVGVDYQDAPIRADLEVGVFRTPRYSFADADLSVPLAPPASGPRSVLYPDPRLPNWMSCLYRMADSSMDLLNILAGDIITAVDPIDGEIVMKEGMLVVVRRLVSRPELEEKTLRQVMFSPGELKLQSRSSAGNIEPIIVPIGDLVNDKHRFMDNVFHIDDGSIWIEGVAARLIRTLPIVDE